MTDAPLAGRKVLIVDDEPDNRELLATILRCSGAEVTTAGSAQEAFDAACRGAFDLLVSDIAMPGEDGHSLIRRLRAANVAKLRSIALTGHARDEDRERARDAGFDLHLSKPISPAELIVEIVGQLGDADPSGSSD